MPEYQRMLLDFRLSFSDTDLFDLLDSLPQDLRVRVAREVSVGYKRLLDLMISSRELAFSSKLFTDNLLRKFRKLLNYLDKDWFKPYIFSHYKKIINLLMSWYLWAYNLFSSRLLCKCVVLPEWAFRKSRYCRILRLYDLREILNLKARKK